MIDEVAYVLRTIIGRYFLGGIGFGLRQFWFYLTKTKSKKSDFDPIIDVEDYMNRIVGLIAVIIILLVTVNIVR